MANELGVPVSRPFAVSGAQAQLFEAGLTVAAGTSAVTVEFSWPTIGRPAILGPDSLPLPPGALRVDAGADLPASTQASVLEALSGRVGLRGVGLTDVQVVPATGLELLRAPDVRTRSAARPQLAVQLGRVTLAERQLYDIVLRDDAGTWSVVAPHAVYVRSSWSDFGLAHITDLHVADRIDRFRGLLDRLGRVEARDKLYNWNDRFRGFIRYANQLHAEGRLDVVVATGDLYDYLFEEYDGPHSGGNPLFLRKLLLGQAPGPEFPDVEELRVPIFLVPGNHDYRLHPYELIFDLHTDAGPLDRDLNRFNNYSGYHLGDSDARALANAEHSRPVDAGVPNLGLSAAARQLATVGDNVAYRASLGEPGPYVVELGPHRLVMLDSGPDVGVVDSVSDLVHAYSPFGSEDEATFIGGSPNCEGVSDDELHLLQTTLASMPPEGLVLVGLHAPLLNPTNNAYAYFLRQTQRRELDQQVTDLLVAAGSPPFTPQSRLVLEHAAQVSHRSWFADDRDHRGAPDYVKRGDSQDLLDFGVSRGRADDVLRALAARSTQAPAIVLAGHTHRHNEFVVRTLPTTGELAYYFDFFTANPARYYPTRYTHDFSTWPQTRVTYVQVAEGTPPGLTPWPMPYDAMHDYTVQVPPYPDPLATTDDPVAWWRRHPLLVLQTGALGPLEDSQVSFSGFRLLTVQANTVARIDFLSTRRLELSGYRMSFEDAVRPDPAPEYRYVARSQALAAAQAAGSPVLHQTAAADTAVAVYRDEDGHLHELWRKGIQTGTSDLTQLAGAPAAASDPSAYLSAEAGLLVVPYRGTDDHVHTVYWSTGPVGHDALSTSAGAPTAQGVPAGLAQQDGTNYVVYRSGDGHLHGLWWKGQARPGHDALTASANAPRAAGDPMPYVNTRTGENLVAYRGTDGHVHTLYWTTGVPGHDDLSGVAGSPAAAGEPSACYVEPDDAHQITYRSADGHLHELAWIGANPVRARDLMAVATGAPPAASDPTTSYVPATDTCHVIYRSADGHLHELSWPRGTTTAVHLDLTLSALAPPADGRPAALAQGADHSVVYRGGDGEVHEIRWTRAHGRTPRPRPEHVPRTGVVA